MRVDSPSPPEVHTCSPEGEDAAPGASQSASEDGSKANTEKANNSTDADPEADDQSMTLSCRTNQTAKLISLDKSSKPETSRGWAQFERQMERLQSAVKRATAISATQKDDTAEADDTTIVIKTITLSLTDNVKFLLPWDVCRTWQVVVSFLK